MPSPFRFNRPYVLAGVLTSCAALLAGCHTFNNTRTSEPVLSVPNVSQPETHRLTPVIRHGRYTLVELAPQTGQQDLLQQVIHISIPDAVHATVGDALRYVLMRSGYRLCPVDPETEGLYDLPLPAAHLRLGPMTLRDALLTLTGSAWSLSVDDAAREVCFSRYQVPSSPPLLEQHS